MTGLLKAEFLRLVSRRVAWGLLLSVVALAALISLTASGMVRPLTPSDVSEARQQHQQAVAEWDQECGGEPASFCEGWPRPQFDDFLIEPSGYSAYLETTLGSGGLLALIAALVLGGSFVGAEFAAGTMGAQLTFTPQRLRVMAVKLGVATVGGLVLLLAWVAATIAVGSVVFLVLRGAAGMTFDAGVALIAGRLLLTGTMLALLAAALAIGLASSGLTAALLTVLAVGSLIVSQFLKASSLLLKLLPYPNLIALVDGGYTHWVSADEDSGATIAIGYWWALGYAVAVLVIVVSVTAIVFRRRDILR